MNENKTKDSVSETDNQGLKSLAKDLALNYFNVSVSNDETPFQKLPPQIFSPKFIQETIKERQWSRTILVIGAGASFNAYNFLPMGKQSISLVEHFLGFDKLMQPSEVINKISKYEQSGLNNLQQKYWNLANSREIMASNFQVQKGEKDFSPTKILDDFETRLFLLSHYYPEREIRDNIQLLYNYRTYPSMFYEIVAHLFKHRFIDIIINFNFDELLDQAIEEEIGKSDYHLIISDGDCKPISKLIEEGRLKVPIYIKPHGSVSHKSAMRFTKEQYLEIPGDIKEILEKLISGKTSDNDSDPTREKVNLIIAGFAMESVEFNEILEKHLPENVVATSFYYSDLEEDVDKKAINEEVLSDPSKVGQNQELKKNKNQNNKPQISEKSETDRKDSSKSPSEKMTLVDIRNQNLSFLAKILKSPFESFERKVAVELIHVNGSEKDLGKRFLDLFKQIQGHFKKPFVPKGIERHLLILEFFKQEIHVNREKKWDTNDFLPPKNLYFSSEDYYLKRTILEILIVASKNNGLVEIESAIKGRIGLYFSLFLESKGKLPKSTLNEFFEAVGLKSNRLSFGRNIYTFEGYDPHEEYSIEVFAKDAAKVRQFDAESPVGEIGKNILDWVTKEGKGWDLLKTLFQTNAYEINPRFKDKGLLKFDHIGGANVLPTNLSLTYRFLEEIIKDEWDIILSVSERGKFIKNLIDPGNLDKHSKLHSIFSKDSKRRLLMVLSERASEESLYQKGFSNSLLLLNDEEECDENGLRINYLPYYAHNHHFIVFLKANHKQQSFDSVSSIYFKKDGYSNTINPVFFKYSEKMSSNFSLLLETFFAYLLKAKEYKKHGNLIGHINNSEELVVDIKLKKLYSLFIKTTT